VHAAILGYRQPRKNASREAEYEAGRAAFQRYLDTARALDDVGAVVDACDFLATFEVELPSLPLAEAEQLIFRDVEPAAREFGMFESIWRDLQDAER
jgi:hypothetical protein